MPPERRVRLHDEAHPAEAPTIFVAFANPITLAAE